MGYGEGYRWKARRAKLRIALTGNPVGARRLISAETTAGLGSL
jgi:hypothetical protein